MMSIIKACVKRGLDGYLPLDEQFFKATWEKACFFLVKNRPEPDDLRSAKIEAIRSLNLVSGDEMTWEDFKRGYEIMTTWFSNGRLQHAIWTRQIEGK